MLTSWIQVVFCHVIRSANSLADFLAKQGEGGQGGSLGDFYNVIFVWGTMLLFRVFCFLVLLVLYVLFRLLIKFLTATDQKKMSIRDSFSSVSTKLATLS